MSRIKKQILVIWLIMSLMVIGCPLFSQVPPTPTNHGDEGGPVGGSAPIGDGTLVLIFLAAAYGAYKVYFLKKKPVGLGKD